jgi:GTPase SAR1 family protein
MSVKIEPIKLKEYTSKQSKHDFVPKVPFRSIVLGPSGSGKTVLITNLILDVYKDVFQRIFIFSPSVSVDASWHPVIDYIKKDMKVDTNQEEVLFDHYDAEALNDIIDNQHKLIDYMKKKDMKKLYNILVVVDDFADDPRFVRQSKMLQALYIRGRHTMISTITATQVFTALSPTIRKNITELYVYRLRNYRDLESLIEELSALYPKKTLLEIYNHATDKPHSFLFINLVAKDKRKMFMENLDKFLLVK